MAEFIDSLARRARVASWSASALPSTSATTVILGIQSVARDWPVLGSVSVRSPRQRSCAINGTTRTAGADAPGSDAAVRSEASQAYHVVVPSGEILDTVRLCSPR